MARHRNEHTHQGRMAPLIAMLLAAAYAVDSIDTAPTPKKVRRRSKEERAALPPPSIPSSAAILAPPTSIHPIFRLGIVQDPKQLFRPALELASRFLTSDAFLGYWYIAFYSPVTDLPIPTRRDIATPPPGTKHFGFTAALPTHLTRAQIAITDLALADLANSLTLDLRSSSPERAGGRCKHLRHEPALPPFRGHRSCIQISSYFYDMLGHPAVSEADKTWLQFELAKTLLHEVAHAALNAARAKGSREHFFFRGCAVAEDGFQLEACLFGGKIDLRRAEFHDAVAGHDEGYMSACSSSSDGRPLIRGFMTPWPSWEAVEEYRVRGSLIGVRGPVARCPRGREVGFERVRRLFTGERWEEDVGRFGSLRLCF
ncbi:hypothetical protein LTR29_010278 [Friedmanniomyces endolithicus]|nr:hypothetical protein LTR29_010278 [Friedmanniomyces endolithicus]